jgi:hypothetical protein
LLPAHTTTYKKSPWNYDQIICGRNVGPIHNQCGAIDAGRLTHSANSLDPFDEAFFGYLATFTLEASEVQLMVNSPDDPASSLQCSLLTSRKPV